MSDPYALHQLVMSGFPDEPVDRVRQKHGVLFRLEEERRQIIVQSTSEPRWIVSSADAMIDGPKPMDPFLGRLEEGGVYRFRLLANPTRRVARRAALGPDPTRGRVRPERTESVGKRVAIRGDAQLLDWLGRVGQAKGFDLVHSVGEAATIPNVRVRRISRLSIRAPGRPAPIVIEVADFEGLLRVVDRTSLISAIRDGIGPAKAFGCGLLSIAPQ
jgi:CRISPR system Cascade subunit CasE